jgi:hypothetical protein
VTNSGPTTINGDLGLAGTSLTGAPSVNGVTNVGNAPAGVAIADAQTAFSALKALACTNNMTTTELGGLTLFPGVYCFQASNIQITGTLVLDSQGAVAPLFVFKVAGVLAVGSSSGIGMINGGSICNLFFAVTSCSLGSTAFMVLLLSFCVCSGRDLLLTCLFASLSLERSSRTKA